MRAVPDCDDCEGWGGKKNEDKCASFMGVMSGGWLAGPTPPASGLRSQPALDARLGKDFIWD